MLLGVEFYARGAEDPGRGGGLAAGQGADAQDELGEGEGLGGVVIGAEVKSADPLLRGAGRGQHEDHDWLAGLGDGRAERVAVDAGPVAGEQDDATVWARERRP